MWNTEKINHISEQIDRGKTLKSILRSISIDTILEPESKTPIFPFYLSHRGEINSGLRASDIPFEFTKSEVKKYKSCYHNPLELYNIIEKSSLIHEKWINNYHSNRFNLNISPILESSKLIAFCAVHYILFNHDKSIILFDDSDDIMQIFIQIYKNIPFYLKPGICSQNDHYKLNNNGLNSELSFDNGSKIVVSEYNKSIIYNADFVIVNELSKVIDSHTFAFNFIPLLAKAETRMMICTSVQNNILYNSDSFSIFEKLNIFEYLREINLDILI